MTRDDFARAVDGGTDGKLEEVHQYLANRVAAGHICHGGGHVVVGGVLRFRLASFWLTEVCVVNWLCILREELSILSFRLDIIISSSSIYYNLLII